MPFDAVFLSAVQAELRPLLIGSRIDKIQMPARDLVLMHVRGPGGSGRLLLSASGSSPRLHMTAVTMENPPHPPMFCMLLRKHLIGGRISQLIQPPMERVIQLVLDCTDEMGEPVQKTLVLELMGRNSNLILLGKDGRILDCIRRVDFEMSEKRQILPGLFYRLPPPMEKTDPFSETAESICHKLYSVSGYCRFDQWLLNTYGGLSPLICRELAYDLFSATDAQINEMSSETKLAAADALSTRFRSMSQEYTPVMLRRNGVPSDFSFRPIGQYGEYENSQEYDSFSQLLDHFYADREHAERMRQKTQVLRKTVENMANRIRRKLEIQRKECAAACDRERLRQLGDIVTANLHAMQRGQTVLYAVDFYDPHMGQIQIPLSPQISPQQNAAKYYKDYTRAKNAEKILAEQIEKGSRELLYLESILHELSCAETEKDVAEIRQELIQEGYLKDTDKKRTVKTPPSKPMEFCSSDGYTIRVGRNNHQNDMLTLKLSAKNDLWLHVQKLHGSHVVIQCEGVKPPDRTITEAAMLAAWYSQAKDSQNVPVDVTPIKQIKKPAGSKPGMVIYHVYNTVYVTPDADLPQKCRR